MIEWIVIVSIAWIFGCTLFICAWPAFAGPLDAYLPSEEYAEDFAARLSGTNPSPGSTPSVRGAACLPVEPGDVVDFRRLGTGPRGLTTRTTPDSSHPRPAGAEKDRPLHIAP